MTQSTESVLASFDLPPSLGMRIADLAGMWCVEERAAAAAIELIRSTDWQQHAADPASAALAEARNAVDMFSVKSGEANVAVVPVRGMLAKQADSMSISTSTVQLRQTFRRLSRDASVDAVVLAIDSPGGTVSGQGDMVADLQRLRAAKPVVAFVEDLAASAAYWLAASTDHLIANQPDALVGSIGTYMVMVDSSAAAEQEGIRVHLIRTGPLKGEGTPGTPISEAVLTHVQQIVGQAQQQFDAAVMSGRKLTGEQLASVKHGSVITASDALTSGLIDAIDNFDAAVLKAAQLAAARQRSTKRATSSHPQEKPAMSEQNDPQPKAATYAEIVAACKGVDRSKAEDSQFITDQLAVSATVAQAQAAWMDTLTARTEAARIEAAEAKAKAAKPGLDLLREGNRAAKHDAGDPVAAWNDAINTHIKAGKSKRQATLAVAAAEPELHDAYIAAVNAR